MKLFKPFALTLCALPMAVMAQQVELNYDGFFDRMKDLDEPEYQGVKLAFYFVDRAGQPCPVKQAKLATKLKSKEVYVLETGEILLPYDPILDQDKASLVIDKVDDRECGLNMRLESNQLFGRKLSKEEVVTLTDKFAVAFDDLGGMMSFMLPKVHGVTFQFAEDVKASVLPAKIGKCDVKGCTVLKSELVNYQGEISFNQKPIKAVPYIQ